jgi:hypothetical protein
MGQENLVILSPVGRLRRGGLVYQCCCLSCPVESISVNAGGSHMEGSSPPMKYASVGAAIVVRARESRVQGEGRQGIDVVLANSCSEPDEFRVNRLPGRGRGAAANALNMTNFAIMRRAEVANPWRARGSETGPPGSEGGVRKHNLVVRLAPTLRDGLPRRHHRHTLAESTPMNVGGLRAKGSRLPMNHASVGGSIVLGVRESRTHGKGSQLVGISTQNSRMPTQGNP